MICACKDGASRTQWNVFQLLRRSPLALPSSGATRPIMQACSCLASDQRSSGRSLLRPFSQPLAAKVRNILQIKSNSPRKLTNRHEKGRDIYRSMPGCHRDAIGIVIVSVLYSGLRPAHPRCPRWSSCYQDRCRWCALCRSPFPSAP